MYIYTEVIWSIQLLPKYINPINMCRGRFCNKGQKCKSGPNLPLGSLEVLIVDNQVQNSKCIMNKRLMVLWQEKIKMLIKKVQKKHKNITGLKLQPIVTEKRKWERLWGRDGRFPYTHISTPKVQNCENVSWLNGFLLSSFNSMGKTLFNRFETSTHSHQEEEIERGCEEKREDTPVLIFSPLRFRIVRMFLGSMGFCSQVSVLWGKPGSTGLKLWPTVSEKRKLREVVRKRGTVPLYPYF